MTKLLITGWLGFIGSHFVIEAIRRWYSVVNIDNETYASNKDNVRIVQWNPLYTYIKWDICDISLLSRIFDWIDIVVHFAAESHVDRSIGNPSIFVETNVLGTHNLLKMALDKGVKRFIHISTDEVYGSLLPWDPPFTETSNLDPSSAYSASKAGADLLTLSYFKTFGLSATITRCSNNFGPHQDSSKLIPVIINNALLGRKIPIYWNWSNIRDWIYVKDHVNGVFCVMDKWKAWEVYNFGGGMEIDNLSLCKMILKILNVWDSLIEFVGDRPGHDYRYAINDSKAQNELGWRKSSESFEENLIKTIDFYKSLL